MPAVKWILLTDRPSLLAGLAVRLRHGQGMPSLGSSPAAAGLQPSGGPSPEHQQEGEGKGGKGKWLARADLQVCWHLRDQPRLHRKKERAAGRGSREPGASHVFACSKPPRSGSPGLNRLAAETLAPHVRQCPVRGVAHA